jgi:hypothetical protein
MDDLLTLGQAAKRMRVSRMTAHNWDKRGLMPVVKIGGMRFFIADKLPNVVPVTQSRVFLEYPEGFEDGDILEHAKELGYIKE